jgi:hypothetical protein
MAGMHTSPPPCSAQPAALSMTIQLHIKRETRCNTYEPGHHNTSEHRHRRSPDATDEAIQQCPRDTRHPQTTHSSHTVLSMAPTSLAIWLASWLDR